MKLKRLGRSVKRIVILVSTILLFVVIQLYAIRYTLYPVYAAGATLSLSPSSGAFNKGCTIPVEVKLDTGGVQTDGTDAIIFYDPTRLTASAIRSGTIYADYPGNSIDTQNGRIIISGLSSVSAAFAGQGTLAAIDFTVPSSAQEGAAQVTFDFDVNDKTKTTDSNIVERGAVVDILSEVTNGNFTIGTGSCNAAVTPTPAGKGQVGDTLPLPTKTLSPGGKDPGVALPTVMVAAAGTLFLLLGAAGLIRR